MATTISNNLISLMILRPSRSRESPRTLIVELEVDLNRLVAVAAAAVAAASTTLDDSISFRCFFSLTGQSSSKQTSAGH